MPLSFVFCTAAKPLYFGKITSIRSGASSAFHFSAFKAGFLEGGVYPCISGEENATGSIFLIPCRGSALLRISEGYT